MQSRPRSLFGLTLHLLKTCFGGARLTLLLFIISLVVCLVMFHWCVG